MKKIIHYLKIYLLIYSWLITGVILYSSYEYFIIWNNMDVWYFWANMFMAILTIPLTFLFSIFYIIFSKFILKINLENIYLYSLSLFSFAISFLGNEELTFVWNVYLDIWIYYTIFFLPSMIIALTIKKYIFKNT